MQLTAHLDVVSGKACPLHHAAELHAIFRAEQSRATRYSRTRKPKQASEGGLSTRPGEAL